MNRNKKLIKNVLILLVYFVLSRYFGGYYFSKEKCERDILRSLYATDDMFVMEFPKDSIYTLDLSKDITQKIYFDPNDKMISFVGIVKRGIFYRSQDSYMEDILKYNNNDIVGVGFSLENEDFFLVYRNNPNVYSIEIERMDDSTDIYWNWKEDFICLLFKEDVKYKGTCKAFDEQGNLITEIRI